MLIVLAVDGYATLLERVISNKIGGISVERLTYDFCIAGKHYWQVKGADDLECSEVCRSRDDEGCNGCPIANAFDRLAAIEDILGDDYDLDRLKELVQADREGRCMVAKLKIGEHVFVVGKKKIVKARIQEIYFDDMSELIYLVDFECDNSCDGCPFNSWSQSWEGEWECDGEYGDGSVKQSDFGKTVFLTREEAEAALEKMKEGK